MHPRSITPLSPSPCTTPVPSVPGAPASGPAAAGGTWRMVAAMALSGTIGLLVVESGLPVLLVVWLRCAFGAMGLAAWVLWSRQWAAPRAAEWAWMLAGGMALVLNWVCLFRAYHYSGIAVATVVYHTQPFLLLVLAALLQGEALPLRRLPWLLLALLGVVLSSGLAGQAPGQALPWTGIGLALLAAALYAVATLATQRLRRLAPAQIAMWQMLMGVVLLAVPAWSVWSAPGAAAFSLRAGVSVLILGLVHTAWMYVLMYAAFQRLPARAIAGLSFIYPAIALLVDLAWFGTQPQPAQWLGMGLILGAVWAYRRTPATR